MTDCIYCGASASLHDTHCHVCGEFLVRSFKKNYALWGLFGFLFAPAGLFLSLTWRKTEPRAALASLTGVLASTIFCSLIILLSILQIS